MNMILNDLLSNLKDRHVRSDIIDRVARLNADLKEGRIPHGLGNRTHGGRRHRWSGLMGRAEVVRVYGASAWRDMPAAGFDRLGGKRKAAKLEALRDQLWLVPADHWTRQFSHPPKPHRYWRIPT